MQTVLHTTRLVTCLLGLFVFVSASLGLVFQTATAKADAGSRHQSFMRVSFDTHLPIHRKVTVGHKKSMIVEVPRDLRDVVVSEPLIVDALVQTANRVYLIGKDIGNANAFFFDQNGERIMTLEISVERDPRPLEDMLNKLIPNAAIKVEVMADTFILTGTVPRPIDANRASDLARRFAVPDAKNEGKSQSKVVNYLAVQGKEQIMLKVTIAEMNRDVIKRFGVNGSNFFLNQQNSFASTFLDFPVTGGTGINNYLLGNVGGEDCIVPGGIGVPGTVGNLGQGAATFPNNIPGGSFNCVTKTLEAFERSGLSRILAEPNLTTISGETASFLAGGEFPIQIFEDGGFGVEYKQFGVSLAFTPFVLSSGRISLKLSTEVSDVDATLSTTTGIGIAVRRANSTVELPSGGSMAIAGLISDNTLQNIDKVPGLGKLPILGTLFRSRDFRSQETELVIIITPFLVKPTHRSQLARADKNFMPASDLKGNFLGQLNRIYGEKTEIAAGSTKDVGWIVE